jgi:hypothetical protein
MNAEHTVTALKSFCKANSGDEQMWENKGTTYYWNRGKDTSSGLVNGVVRKLAGVDANGHKIWTVAGSIKIDSDGTILRFTGMPKKQQKLLQGISAVTTQAKTLQTV